MKHKTFRIETDVVEEWGSLWDPPPEVVQYRAGLTRYYIDDVQVTEEEFTKAAAETEQTSADVHVHKIQHQKSDS